LRDAPVLAKDASEIAAVGTDREDFRARLEVIEGFFLDGIDIQGDGVPVFGGDEGPGIIQAHHANPQFSRGDFAFDGTEAAFDAALFEFLIVPGFDFLHAKR
jgi:hypothetical protein